MVSLQAARHQLMPVMLMNCRRCSHGRMGRELGWSDSRQALVRNHIRDAKRVECYLRDQQHRGSVLRDLEARPVRHMAQREPRAPASLRRGGRVPLEHPGPRRWGADGACHQGRGGKAPDVCDPNITMMRKPHDTTNLDHRLRWEVRFECGRPESNRHGAPRSTVEAPPDPRSGTSTSFATPAGSRGGLTPSPTRVWTPRTGCVSTLRPCVAQVGGIGITLLSSRVRGWKESGTGFEPAWRPLQGDAPDRSATRTFFINRTPLPSLLDS